MLLKIFITLAVILAVALIFRVKQPKRVTSSTEKKRPEKKGAVSSSVVVYTLLGLIVSISILIFVLNWTEQHRIINIRITSSQGEITNYQAYQKDIEGRKFLTLDGVNVTLGASDRVEMLD